MKEKMCCKRKGLLLIVTGIIFVLAAIGLLCCNKAEEYAAASISAETLMQLQSIELEREKNDMDAVLSPEMAEIEIDGDLYIGQLSIPTLDLNLPILSQWSYPGLKKAPCRYSGTQGENNLVLLGHNYKRHFGYLHTLNIGSTIEFQDVNGNIQTYEVVAVETVSSTDIEKVTGGEYALTLFTCTYGGQYRTMVGCKVVIPSES